jgi:hypothetical protein
VSISGDYAIVGAPYDDDSGLGSGSAYIFERGGGSWTQVAKLLASDGGEYDYFGRSVSISGDYAIVGAVGDDDSGLGSGSAYIFERSNGSWTQVAKLLASDGTEEDYFSYSVSISGSHAIVGAYRDDDNVRNSGSAYIFECSGGSWTQLAKVLASDGARRDEFGAYVSISDDYAIVGAVADDDNGRNSGSAYIFTLEQPGPWVIITDAYTTDEFGSLDVEFNRRDTIQYHFEYDIVGAGPDPDVLYVAKGIVRPDFEGCKRERKYRAQQYVFPSLYSGLHMIIEKSIPKCPRSYHWLDVKFTLELREGDTLLDTATADHSIIITGQR